MRNRITQCVDCRCWDDTDLIERHDFLLCSLIKGTAKQQKIASKIKYGRKMDITFANGWQRPNADNASQLFLDIYAELQLNLLDLIPKWERKAPFWKFAGPILKKKLGTIYWGIDHGFSPHEAATARKRQRRWEAEYRRRADAGDEKARTIIEAFDAGEIRLLPNRIDSRQDDWSIDEIDRIDDGKRILMQPGQRLHLVDNAPSLEEALKMIEGRGSTNGRPNSRLRALAEYWRLYDRYPDWAECRENHLEYSA